MTCAKNMQTAGKVQVVQLPKLYNSKLCPVLALKTMLKNMKDTNKDSPLFQIQTRKGYVPVIAVKVRSFFKTCIVGLGLHPKDYTFHSFLFLHPKPRVLYPQLFKNYFPNIWGLAVHITSCFTLILL